MVVFETPILLLVFNRPDNARRLIQRIKERRPKFIFVAADGPRSHKPGESERCQEVRNIITKEIDWECIVKKLYRDENLGCGHAVSSAITWFFQHVEEGIILEDDTLPDLSFFEYCTELLHRYRNDTGIHMISGDNFRLGRLPMKTSYGFTIFSHVWGWATWRRAWESYDFAMKDWPQMKEEGLIQSVFNHEYERHYWIDILEKTYKGLEDTWDYQWYYTCWKTNRVSIEPATNLVKNIGFGKDATHTIGEVDQFIFGSQPASFLKVTSHPPKIQVDRRADALTFINRYLNGNDPNKNKYNAMTIVRRGLSKVKRILFPDLSVGYATLYARKKFLPTSLPTSPDGKTYVHLGCGEIDWPNFINVDVRAYNHIHYLHKVDTLPFLKDNSSDLVYVSHCLEHIPFRETNAVLQEWRRVLKPGGILRISVPDFDLLLKIYSDNNQDMNSILYPLMGAQDYEFNFHYNSFNYSSLEALLYNAGFEIVRKWQYGKDQYSSLPDWSGKNVVYNKKEYPVSLNIEAVK